MKTIVVIAENLTQFNDYVDKVLESEIEVKNQYNRIKIEAIEFLWVLNHYNLVGRNFSKDSKIVKVGSWYNLPKDELKAIEENFESKKVK